MTPRSRSSRPATSGQRMRGSQSSQPRHIPDVAGLPYDPFYAMDPESAFPDPSYTLTSIPSEYSSQGHVPDFPWSHPGHGHSPDGNASLISHGEYSPSYATSMADYEQHPPSYTASMASSTMYPEVLPWTSSNATSINQSSFGPMDNDYDMLSENMSSESSGSDFTSLHTEVNQLIDHQFSGAMSSTNAFMFHGSHLYGNLDEGMPFIQNNVDIIRRPATDNIHQPWTQNQQNVGMGQRWPLTPPASDRGTPPTTQECPSLSSQDTCYDTYDHDRYPLSQEGHQTRHTTLALTGIAPRNQVHSVTTKRNSVAQRPIRSASDRRGSHDSEDLRDFQPEGNHVSEIQPRNHPLYQMSKDPDGLYRCPFQEESNCNHEPTVQKCGYDKYLDSHLRPFVCTHSGCNSPQFSSNACLFRHQREAHGLHGHGENPHLCHYPGCERAQDRNGFPRKWNLKDHMKRVHGWEESDDSPSSGSPPTVSQKPGHQNRRRKGGSPVASVQMKRQSSSQAKARAASTSFYQSSQYQHAVDPAYPAAAKRSEPGRQYGYSYQGNSNFKATVNSHCMQTGAYTQQFDSQEYFA